MLPIIIRKRTIAASDIPLIQSTINEHWGMGRTHISRILCQRWNWVQPSGRPKDMACRELLLTLARKGYVTLPPSLSSANNDKRNQSIPVVDIDQTPLQGCLSDLPPVTLVSIRNTHLESLYNSLVHHNHYLGYRQIVGQHLKYMAFIDDRPVACLGWGSAAWAVKSRESFVGWKRAVKDQNLHMVVNNIRFLVLPWVSVKCLASKLLSLNIKMINQDWPAIYHHPIYLLETFVERDRFMGTCYKAANWIHVGKTKGTSKKGHDHMAHGNIKDVYLYPLRRDFREKLINENNL